MIESDTKEQMPMIFLVGPPGAGKSSLGKKVCEKLELPFADLSTPQINIQPIPSQKEFLTDVICQYPGGKFRASYNSGWIELLGR